MSAGGGGVGGRAGVSREALLITNRTGLESCLEDNGIIINPPNNYLITSLTSYHWNSKAGQVLSLCKTASIINSLQYFSPNEEIN